MKRIYIVDDDKNIVESLAIVLESKGYEVQAQHDEENLVKNIRDFGSDLVILDVIFPEDDGAGFDMARTLKTDERTKDVPILMLSAVNQKGVYAGTFSNRDRDETWLPVDEFVEKPISPTDLVQKVGKLIDT